MSRFDEAKFALEAATGGKNSLLFDDLGMPSVMVRIPQFKWSEVIDGGEEQICSAFIVNGKPVNAIYISKYMNVIENKRAYSLPNREPAYMITIEDARESCAKKGRGWHLMTNAEWMAIAFWSRKNGTLPRGNNNFGRDFFAVHEHGVTASVREDGETERTLTGSGPCFWSHDHTDSGIMDMHGNLWDILAGLRIVDGELQIIPDNDSALNIDESSSGKYWRAIADDGSLVTPGSANTFKYDGVQPGIAEERIITIPGGVKLSTSITLPEYTGTKQNANGAYACMNFQRMTSEKGIIPHMYLKKLGLFPLSGEHGNERLFVRNYGERFPSRGGSWFDNAYGGLFELYMRDSREYRYPDLGFRAAYIDL